MNYLDISAEKLKSLGAFWTAKEIQQQPEAWKKTQIILNENLGKITDFMKPLLATPELRIIFTGAGTSAFAGGCIAAFISGVLDNRIEAIATTDLVSNPYQYLKKEIPTLLVSFARSGNSPESLAATEISEALVNDCYQVILTCNKQGKLYQKYKSAGNCLTLLMPEETNDQSFAMTSSFTSMMYAAFSLFSNSSHVWINLDTIIKSTTTIIRKQNSFFKELAEQQFSRVVYLGSGGLKPLAEESALKLLELTDGKVVATHDSPLGFRHGPKTIVNNDTVVIMFISNHPYTRLYDLDLLKELRDDQEVARIIAISGDENGITDGEYLLIEDMQEAQDSSLIFPFIACAQIYALHHSLALGNKPDTPSESGSVNRVVQGVNIHPLPNNISHKCG